MLGSVRVEEGSPQNKHRRSGVCARLQPRRLCSKRVAVVSIVAVVVLWNLGVVQHYMGCVGDTVNDQECSALSMLSEAGLAGNAIPNSPHRVFMHFRKAAAPVAFKSALPLTIVTPLTYNRMQRLLTVAQLWQGPISAAMFVCSRAELAAAVQQFDRTPALRAFVSLHVIVGKQRYFPINVIRNVAINGSSTEWIMYMDVDANPSGDMAAVSRDVAAAMVVARSEGIPDDRAVFVVPAFEFTTDAGMRQDWPLTKAELRRMYNDGDITNMHPCCRGYSGPFKAKAWMRATTSYTIQYEEAFEPYFVARRPLVPFDERFAGRRRNKHALFFELYAAGYSLHVLADSWVIDSDLPSRSHAQSSAGKVEPLNTRKWAQFLYDTAHRYNLTCTDPAGCWWRREDIEHRAFYWSIYEAYLQFVEC